MHEAVAGGDGQHRRRRVITRRVIVIVIVLVLVGAVSYCRVGCGFHLDLDLDAKAVAGVAEGPVRAFDVELDGIVRHGQRAVPVGHRGSVREEVHDDHELVGVLGEVRRRRGASAAARPRELCAVREVESHAYLRGVDVAEDDDVLGPLRGLLRCEGRDGPALDDVARGVELLHGSKGNFEKITRLVAGVNLELGSLADELDADARVGRRRWGR